MELEAHDSDPFCPPMRRLALKKITFIEGRSGEERKLKEKRTEHNENDENSKGENPKGENSEGENSKGENSKVETVNEMRGSSRNHTVRSESILSSDGEQSRKRKSRSKDRSQVQTRSERVSSSKRRRKASGQGRRDSFHHGSSTDASPPPLRKNLVRALRAMSEAIYRDTAQVEAQQARSPLPWEQLSALTRLWGPLHAMTQTFYSLANQAAMAVPAEGWLLPAPACAPEDPPRQDSQSPSSEGGREVRDAVPKSA